MFEYFWGFYLAIYCYLSLNCVQLLPQCVSLALDVELLWRHFGASWCWSSTSACSCRHVCQQSMLHLIKVRHFKKNLPKFYVLFLVTNVRADDAGQKTIIREIDFGESRERIPSSVLPVSPYMKWPNRRLLFLFFFLALVDNNQNVFCYMSTLAEGICIGIDGLNSKWIQA